MSEGASRFCLESVVLLHGLKLRVQHRQFADVLHGQAQLPETSREGVPAALLGLHLVSVKDPVVANEAQM